MPVYLLDVYAKNAKTDLSGDVDVAKFRAKLKLSQSEFVDLLDVSNRVVQDWEQRRKARSGAARSLLRVAQKMPAAVRRALAR